MSGIALLADVGGTNARFALSHAAGHVDRVATFKVGAHATFLDALACYLAGENAARIAVARIAAAGPVAGGAVQLTNAAWRIEAGDVVDAIGAPVSLYNDLEAVACLLPHVREAHLVPLGGQWRVGPPATRIAVNVGTGFGAASAHWRPRASDWAVTCSEAGHMSRAWAGGGRSDFGGEDHSVEALLSGPALDRIYRARVAGATSLPRYPSVFAAAAAGDPTGQTMTALFADALGATAGDLVLANAAWGGVFLCGSVAQGWREVADAEAQLRFRRSFVAKGKMRGRLETVPTWWLTLPDPALLGLSYA